MTAWALTGVCLLAALAAVVLVIVWELDARREADEWAARMNALLDNLREELRKGREERGP